MRIRLKILTPERTEVDKDVDFVRLEAVNGSLGILPEHAPLAAQLKESSVFYHMGKQEEIFDIKGGFARVLPDCVTVFAA